MFESALADTCYIAIICYAYCCSIVILTIIAIFDFFEFFGTREHIFIAYGKVMVWQNQCLKIGHV